jgi:hypothetical protein
MYFNIDGRDENYYLKLKIFIEENYQLKIISIKEYNRGWYGETWKIECSNNCNYFVKIIYFEKQAKKYRQWFPVLNFMHLHGINYVSKVYNTQFFVSLPGCGFWQRKGDRGFFKTRANHKKYNQHKNNVNKRGDVDFRRSALLRREIFVKRNAAIAQKIQRSPLFVSTYYLC